MSRHQFQHGRTLDALELRGGVPVKAAQLGVGDRVLRLFPDPDFTVTAVEHLKEGCVRVHGAEEPEDFGEYEFVYRAALTAALAERGR